VEPGPTTQAHREGQKDDSEEDLKDLDKKVLWLVPFPNNKGHWKVWQKGIQMAKNIFKVDGAEYTFSTWFAKILSKDLINILLITRSEKKVAKKAKELYLHREWHDEKRISEYIEVLIKEYKAEDKGSPKWKEYIESVFETAEMYKARIIKECSKEILNAIDDDKFLIKVKFIREDKGNFKIVDKYEPIYELKKAGKKFVLEGPNIVLTKKTKPGF
jgi:hypothetical protein